MDDSGIEEGIEIVFGTVMFLNYLFILIKAVIEDVSLLCDLVVG